MGSTSASLLGRLRDLGDARAWQEFHARYAPRLRAWCRSKGLQPADADDVTQEVLLRVARRMPTFAYDPGGDFSGWLAKVWESAWKDFVGGLARGGCGTGDPAVYEALQNIPGGDLTRELADEFDREVLHEALARARPQVSPRDWDIFHDLLFGGKSATAVAQEHQLTLAALGMVKLRVQRKVNREVAVLEGRDWQGAEGGP
jgi:RNA polymerase sigma-70 factor (ECF subfamily)